MEIKNGELYVVKGKVKNSFKLDCIEVIRLNNTRFGIIYGVRGINNNPVLKCSSNISREMLQQLRNVWGFGS